MCIELKYYSTVNIFLLQHTANVIGFRDVADDIIFYIHFRVLKTYFYANLFTF